MKQPILTLALSSLLVLPLAGCKKTGKDASRYTKDGLFIVHMQTPTVFCENNIADALGLWKEEGLKADYIGVLTPGTDVPALLSGKIDFNNSHPNNIVKARLAGAKIIAISTGMIDDSVNPHIVYHVQKKSGITGIEGFRELAKKRKIKIAVSGRNGCADWYFDEWLIRGGVPEAALDWVVMPQKQQLEALSKGLVDAITSHPPFIKAADADPNFTRIISSFEIVHNPAAGASVRTTSEKFAKEHPEIVSAFIRVYVKAHEWSNAHPDSAKAIVARAFNQPADKVSLFTFSNRRWLNDSDVNPWLERQIAHKDIKPDAKIKAADIYTNKYNSYWKDAGKPNTFFPGQGAKTTKAPSKAPGLVERTFRQKTAPLRTASR